MCKKMTSKAARAQRADLIIRQNAPQGLFLSVDTNEWQKDNQFAGPMHRLGEPP